MGPVAMLRPFTRPRPRHPLAAHAEITPAILRTTSRAGALYGAPVGDCGCGLGCTRQRSDEHIRSCFLRRETKTLATE